MNWLLDRVVGPVYVVGFVAVCGGLGFLGIAALVWLKTTNILTWVHQYPERVGALLLTIGWLAIIFTRTVDRAWPPRGRKGLP